MRRVLFALILTLLSLTGSPALRAAEVEGKAKLAQDLVNCLSEGKYADVVTMFDGTMKSALPEAKLAEVWKAIQAQAGAFKQQQKVRQEIVDKYVVVYVLCQFEKAPLEAKVVFDTGSKVAGLFFVPPQADDKPADK